MVNGQWIPQIEQIKQIYYQPRIARIDTNASPLAEMIIIELTRIAERHATQVSSVSKMDAFQAQRDAA